MNKANYILIAFFYLSFNFKIKSNEKNPTIVNTFSPVIKVDLDLDLLLKQLQKGQTPSIAFDLEQERFLKRFFGKDNKIIDFFKNISRKKILFAAAITSFFYFNESMSWENMVSGILVLVGFFVFYGEEFRNM